MLARADTKAPDGPGHAEGWLLPESPAGRPRGYRESPGPGPHLQPPQEDADESTHRLPPGGGVPGPGLPFQGAGAGLTLGGGDPAAGLGGGDAAPGGAREVPGTPSPEPAAPGVRTPGVGVAPGKGRGAGAPRVGSAAQGPRAAPGTVSRAQGVTAGGGELPGCHFRASFR